MPTNRILSHLRSFIHGGAVSLLVLIYTSGGVSAQPPVVIDFEGLGPVPVINQYASQGVTFGGSTLATDFSVWGPGFAHSGTNGIQLCFAQEFCDAPLTVNFTTGQAHAKLWIGYIAALNPAQMVKLQALDAGGAVLGQATAMLGPSTAQIPIGIPLEINTPTANIRKLVLRFDAGPGVTTFNNGLLIDDVEFSTSGPAPPCLTNVPPSLTMSQPPLLLPDGPTVRINEFMLQGSVNTAVPLDEAMLVVTKPDGTATTTSVLNSTISSTGGSFGPTRMAAYLAEGRNTVAVRVKNCAGVATLARPIRFEPIPSDVRIRFLGIETTQATQSLEQSVFLVASKPTVVRVYLAVENSAAPIERSERNCIRRRDAAASAAVDERDRGRFVCRCRC
jgi:hypothetical protein